eukprot:14784297-Ditylum_brightwellii.AAC.1
MQSVMISLSNQFEYCYVHKRYEDLVIGQPQPFLNKETEGDNDIEKRKEESFLIDKPINVGEEVF